MTTACHLFASLIFLLSIHLKLIAYKCAVKMATFTMDMYIQILRGYAWLMTDIRGILNLQCTNRYPNRFDLIPKPADFIPSCLQESSYLIYVIFFISVLGYQTRPDVYEQHGRCLIRNRYCLSFASTFGFFVGSMQLILIVFCVVLCFLFCFSSCCVLCSECCLCLQIVNSWLSPSIFANVYSQIR